MMKKLIKLLQKLNKITVITLYWHTTSCGWPTEKNFVWKIIQACLFSFRIAIVVMTKTLKSQSIGR
jgi:hypothetical protein